MTFPNRPRIRPRKSLGQHFLQDDNIVRKIIAAIDIQPSDVLVEIGPGEGALTRLLAAPGRRLKVIDIDPRVVEAMRMMFPGGCVEVIEADFLEVDLASLADSPGSRIRIVGNIPYNITTPILFHVLDNHSSVSDATIMIQKEVALRITAKPGSPDYGILSVFSGYFAETKLLFNVAPTAFFPKPKIVSSVIRLRMRDHPVRQAADESFFRAMVRSTFGKRRKTLRNSLSYFAAEKGFLLPAMPGLSRRPEELSIDELVALSDALFACRGTIGGERLA